MPNEIDDQTRRQIMDDLFAGRKIQAIKTYREATGQGLKESKDFCDALEAALRAESPDKFTTPAAAGCGAKVLLLVVLLSGAGATAYWWGA